MVITYLKWICPRCGLANEFVGEEFSSNEIECEGEKCDFYTNDWELVS